MKKPQFEFRHVGINGGSRPAAECAANSIALLFGQTVRNTPNSVLVGPYIEIMHSIGRGICGHIAFTVQSIPEAAEYLTALGCTVDMDSAVYDPDGCAKLVYLKKEIAGFAIHLFEESTEYE